MFRRLSLVPLCATILVSLAGCAHEPEATVADAAVATPAPVADGYPVPVSAPPVVHTEATVVPVAATVGAVRQDDGRYLLDTGDKLRIFVYGQPNLSRVYGVDHTGMITVPLIGAVKARGLTTFELERHIKSRLGSQYVKDPQVTVDVQQNRPFFILGEVKTAGQYPYVSGMTIENAVAIAGGYSERASDRRFRLTRRTNGYVEQLEVPSDYLVQPGDTVYVYERYF